MRYLLLVITHFASCLLGEKYFQQNVDSQDLYGLNLSNKVIQANLLGYFVRGFYCIKTQDHVYSTKK